MEQGTGKLRQAGDVSRGKFYMSRSGVYRSRTIKQRHASLDIFTSLGRLISPIVACWKIA